MLFYPWYDSPFSQTGEINMKSLLAISELQGMWLLLKKVEDLFHPLHHQLQIQITSSVLTAVGDSMNMLLRDISHFVKNKRAALLTLQQNPQVWLNEHRYEKISVFIFKISSNNLGTDSTIGVYNQTLKNSGKQYHMLALMP